MRRLEKRRIEDKERFSLGYNGFLAQADDESQVNRVLF